MKRIFQLFLLLTPVFLLVACSKDSVSTEEQLAMDIELIQGYLTDNNLTAESTASGLHYIIEEEGTGSEYPTLSSEVTVAYKGYFLNGDVFDQSTSGSSPKFPLSNVILGWQEGIQLFKKNGKGILLIPSGLAYGPSGRSTIPGNTVLIFDVELEDF